MEIKLKRETLSLFSLVYTGCSSQESRAESVVPDTMPDIGRILDTDTAVYLRRKAVGLGKVFLEGEIHAVILYLGEDNTLQKLPIQLPCSFTLDAEPAQEEDRLRAYLTLVRGEGRMVNSRKVSVVVETEACAEIYRPESAELTTDAEGEDLEKLTEEVTFPYIASVESKSFVVSEEFTLPSSAPTIREVLGFDTSAVLSDQRTLGGKAVLQGNARLELRYLGQNGEVLQERFFTAFSQLMDIPDGVEGSADVLLTPEIAYVEVLPGINGGNTVQMELHLTAQMLYRVEKTLSLLSDAYSLHHLCTVQQREIPIRKPGSRLNLRFSGQTLLELPEPATESLFGYVNSSRPERSDGMLRLPVQAHVFYRIQNGAVSTFSRNMTLEIRDDNALTGEYQMGVPIISDPYISPSGGELELRITAEIPAVPVEEDAVRYVGDLSVSDDAPEPAENTPSLILVRPEGRSLWELAKAYGSTQRLIEAANGEEETSLLLIPRAR